MAKACEPQRLVDNCDCASQNDQDIRGAHGKWRCDGLVVLASDFGRASRPGSCVRAPAGDSVSLGLVRGGGESGVLGSPGDSGLARSGVSGGGESGVLGSPGDSGLARSGVSGGGESGVLGSPGDSGLARSGVRVWRARVSRGLRIGEEWCESVAC
ncbi:cuticle collagen dpy-5-like [Penaeus vannamei]|uniref:cuticle collagen dpy-5-like n=1 Tax=Penaeus vannamei TaxID=6689 RepID=UPI00387FABA7